MQSILNLIALLCFSWFCLGSQTMTTHQLLCLTVPFLLWNNRKQGHMSSCYLKITFSCIAFVSCLPLFPTAWEGSNFAIWVACSPWGRAQKPRTECSIVNVRHSHRSSSVQNGKKMWQWLCLLYLAQTFYNIIWLNFGQHC